MSANAAPVSIQQESAHTPGFGFTGPRTTEGKVTASENSLKHGLCSSKLILPGESQAEFEALHQDLVVEYQPGNITETLLVDQFVVDTWRLQRARRVEVRIMETSPDLNIDELNKLARYQTSIERSYHRTLSALQKILAERRRQSRGEASLDDYHRAYDAAFEDAVDEAAYLSEPKTLGDTLITPLPGSNNHFVSQNLNRENDAKQNHSAHPSSVIESESEASAGAKHESGTGAFACQSSVIQNAAGFLHAEPARIRIIVKPGPTRKRRLVRMDA